MTPTTQTPGPSDSPTTTFVLEGIGDTPLVDLSFLPGIAPGTKLLAKLESVNPGGSVKDRPIARILTAALKRGVFRNRTRRLLDSSSGNAGVAYAQLGALLGVPVTLVVPGNASRERRERIRAHGAELVLTDPLEGYDAAIAEARRLAQRFPKRYWYADQYSNRENWLAHYHGTGLEILRAVNRRLGVTPDAFVAGVGTGGTLTGVGRRLREEHSSVHLTAVHPEGFPGIEGLKPFAETDGEDPFLPALFDPDLLDERTRIPIELAVARCRALASAGLFLGPSSGANVEAAHRLAASGRFRTVTTILPDTGERYVSTGLWESDR